MTGPILPTPLPPQNTQVRVNGEVVTAVQHVDGLEFSATITEKRQLEIKLPDHWPVGMLVEIIVVHKGEPAEPAV